MGIEDDLVVSVEPQDDGGATLSGRAGGPCPEPVPVSAVPALIPSANGPDLWREILAIMPPGSVVAGGAVRDFLLGVEPKDIDVFIDMAADGAASGRDPRFGLYRIDNEYERFEEYAAVSDIVCVSSGMLMGRRVDAVVMENYTGGAALVEGFDFGINRCWFDGELHDTPEARSDREAKRATLLLTDRIERSVKRFERLRERWGDEWQIELPAQGIEARQGGNGEAGAVHESPTPLGDAPNTDRNPHQEDTSHDTD